MKLTIATFAFLMLTPAASLCRANVNDDYQACQEGTTAKQQGDADYCSGLQAFKQKDYAHTLSALGRAGRHGGALALLGYMYEKGRGVAPDPARAFNYYQQSAQLGNGDGMHELARCYRYGIGTARNEVEADRWFKQGEAHGTEIGAQPKPGSERREPAQADFDAGVEQYNAKNYSGAFQTFMRAANAGNSRAQLQVGSQYERGEGVAKNYEEAVRWYAKSAAAGEPTAQKNLGQMYENGQGTAENWMLAAEWYQKSASQGSPEGEFALGRCYEFGIGVPQDRAKAIALFRRAGSQGNSQGAYFAKWLSEPTNFIGFRNKAEHDYVMDRLRYASDFIGGDPAGVVFHNSGERNQFIIAFKSNAGFHESQTQWSVRHNNYETCRRGNGSNCQNPGPPPSPGR